MRASTIVVAFVLGCGPEVVPSASSASSGGETTTGVDASSGGVGEANASSGGVDETTSTVTTDASSSGSADVSTSEAETSSDESSTGAPSESCDDAWMCDAECMAWDLVFATEGSSMVTGTAIAPDASILTVGARDLVGDAPGHAFLRRYDGDAAMQTETLLFDDVVGLAQRIPTGIAVAPDGRFAVVGRMYAQPESRRSFVQLLAADGTFIANDLIEEPGGSADATSVVFDSAGTLFVGGLRDAATTTSFLRAYDDALVLLWEHGDAELDDMRTVASLAAVGDGELFALSNARVLRLDSEGTPIWSVDTQTFAPLLVAPDELAATSAGDVVLVGTSNPPAGLSPWAARLDGTTGAILWSREYPPPAGEFAALDGVTTDDDGRVFVTGRSVFAADLEPRFVRQLDCDGEVVWEWTRTSDNDAGLGDLAWSGALGLVLGGSERLGTVEHRGLITRLVLTP